MDGSFVRGGSGSLLIWAVDPFTNSRKLSRRLAWAVQALAGRGRYRVQPVYAVSDPLPGLPSRFHSQVFDVVRDKARHGFEGIVEGIAFDEALFPLKVLEGAGRSAGSKAGIVVEHAMSEGAELIAASMGGRGGISRWLRGNFTESLGFRSRVPVFTLGPLCLGPQHLERAGFLGALHSQILFPTDFSGRSTLALDLLAEFAVRTRSPILIFHKSSPEVRSSWEMAFSSGSAIYADIERERLQAAKANGEALVARAAALGANARFELESGVGGSLTQSILAKAERDVSLVAVTSMKGRAAAGLRGSVSLQVLRRSTIPVWIVHPDSKEHAGAGLLQELPLAG